MSEITPNTPNPVREDAYVEELAEKLGIDPQYIPKSPVWRNEEEIKAIAEMFANMQGGGGTGGGVLVVHATISDAGITLDKTWQEIYDADYAVAHMPFNGRSYGQLINIDNDGEEYTVSFAIISTTPTTDVLTLVASSANGYPANSE
jgi:hypothetical protein